MFNIFHAGFLLCVDGHFCRADVTLAVWHNFKSDERSVGSFQQIVEGLSNPWEVSVYVTYCPCSSNTVSNVKFTEGP